MANVFAAPALGEGGGGRRGQAEGVVQLAIGEQAGVGGDPGAVELELEAAVERDPQGRSLASPVTSAIQHPSAHRYIAEFHRPSSATMCAV